MGQVSSLSLEDREEKLRNILKSKCRFLSPAQLEHIVSNINTKRHYFIKSISCPVKFMNIMTNEVVATPEECLYSTVIPIYGSYHTGFFFKTEKEKFGIKGTMDKKQPAAGVKIELSNRRGFISKTYTLAIFETTH